MKRFFFVLIFSICLGSSAFADTIFLPDANSTQYLPTVKILSYSYSFDGDLVPEGYGSGTLIDSHGLVLTNNHVIEDYFNRAETYDAFQICLTKANDPGRPICEFTASFVARDVARDLAILKIDSTDVRGRNVIFDFYLPYQNSGNYNVGSDLTVVGFPDTGQSTITYTSGLLSGIVTENGINYAKTDADISFGNSGGSVIDSNGNFIGVPTYIIGSYSAEVLGYFFPVKDAVAWITQNLTVAPMLNEMAHSKLREDILRSIVANETGVYKNDYPVFEISLIDGWSFGAGTSLSFDEDPLDDFFGGDVVNIYPEETTLGSPLGIAIVTEDYPFDISLDDVENLLNYFEEGVSIERVKLNEQYPALLVKSSYVDWYDLDGETVYEVAYAIPYGNQLIRLQYAYTESEADRLSEIERILSSFKLDLSKIVRTVVKELSHDEPLITVVNPLENAFMSDESYEFDGRTFFGASFGKKDDYDFYVSIILDEYYEQAHVGDFEKFKQDTLADANDWYDVIASGDILIDGKKAFFYTERFDPGYDEVSFYTDVYIEGDNNSYFVAYFSGEEASYRKNLADFELILRNIKFETAGEGQYLIPNLLGVGSGFVPRSLADIDNYLYEDSIKNLAEMGAFGQNVPLEFNPAGSLSRKDFVLWAVRTLPGTELADFEVTYKGCGDKCFADVDYSNVEEGMLIDFAMSKGAIGGLNENGQYFLKPDEQVSLVASLKIIFELNDFEKWDAPDFVPWFIPYLHLGYMNYVIPYGVADDLYMLNRGEGAFVIDGVNGFY